jgi:hypothetical protein
MEGSAILVSRWIGAVGEENLKLLKKGERGMSVKPIRWSPQYAQYFGEQRSFRG